MIQIYTGNGKGKTTAAIGQSLRAAGQGMRTFFAMFMKDYSYSEIKSLRLLSDFITVKQFGNDDFVIKKESPSQERKKQIQKGISECIDKMRSGKYDLIIMDEAIISIYFKLIEVEDLLKVINQKPSNVELIFTGRYCPQELIDAADLVTEMVEVKHYYQKGVKARPGIES